MLGFVVDMKTRVMLTTWLSAVPQHPDRRKASRHWFGSAAFVTTECAACGHQAPLASNPVTAVDELQVRCRGCGAVLAEVRSSPHTSWLDVRGIRRAPPVSTDQTSRGDA
jgi:ribosomal protein S27E